MRQSRRTFAVAALAACMPAAGASGAKTLLLEPDIRLAKMLMAGGEQERPDWGGRAQAHVLRHARNALLSGGREVVVRGRADLDDAARQILTLHDALRVSMRQSDQGDPSPASMPRGRSWTLGAGAQALAAGSGASQALLIDADGAFTGLARAVFVVGSLAAGVSAPTGLQRAAASLVDLASGDIVWRNSVVASPEADMRIDEGAHLLVTALMQGAPL